MQRIAIGIITITILVLLGIFVLPKFFGTEEKMSVPESSRELPAGLARQPTLIPDVPFTPQAPLGNWEDERQQSGCEEAAALMAMRWVQGRGLTLAEAEREILAISDYELNTYGEFHDLSAQDFINRIFKGYFNYDNVRVQYGSKKDDITRELSRGNLVLVPTNGQKLNNPYYKLPGPLQHMLVIRGYDPATKEFITNDPGTKRGELFRYPENVVMDAVYEYPTGNHEPVSEIQKVMIVVEPDA